MLARIIFSEMIKGELMEEHGFGINTYGFDADFEGITINTGTQTVKVQDDVYSYEGFINEFKKKRRIN